jgi:hypothetical protein
MEEGVLLAIPYFSDFFQIMYGRKHYVHNFSFLKVARYEGLYSIWFELTGKAFSVPEPVSG